MSYHFSHHFVSRRLLLSLLLLTCLYISSSGQENGQGAPASIIANSGFENDADGDGWPDQWPTMKTGGSWQKEEGNAFLRFTSSEPGSTVMLYREISIPAEAKALKISWKHRLQGLKKGKQSWFDARMMLEFMDAERNKVSPTPKALNFGRDIPEWTAASVSFLVPEKARTLKVMPALLQVESGVWDLDDLTIESVDPAPIEEEVRAAQEARRIKLEANAKIRRTKAKAQFEKHGSLIPNGDFETDAKADGWPDHWGKAKAGGSWENEEGNHYLRLQSPEPHQMVMLYQQYDIPEGIEALEMTWRQRVTGLKKGKAPWFDARFLFEIKDVAGKKISSPSSAFTQKDTKGWVEKSTRFLVPEGALTLVVMPALFQAEAGVFDLDNISLKPTDPAPILAAKKDRERMEKARFVPAEEPDKAKWPRMLKVVGNRLHDPDGNEVWLQGVNAGGLETLPHDQQVVKSVVVAIDEWKANCVRVPMKEEFWWGKSPYQKDGGQGYRELLGKIITLAANRGAYVVIDLHRYRAPKKEHGEFWKEFAALYKDHPAVLFDVFNEPHGISWDVWKNGGFVGEKKGADESAFLSEEEKRKNQGFESIGMQGLVDAVRSTGAKNIIIAGGMFWCNDLSKITHGYALDDHNGNGVMYSWHTYNWHTDWAGKVLETAAKYPIFLGEVGADEKRLEFIPASAYEAPATWVPDMLGFIQQHKINWTGWCFHDRAAPRMLLNWDYEPTPFWGEPAKRALAGEQFEMKRMR